MAVKPDFELLRDFPPEYQAPYHEGLGDLEPVENPQYGKRRVVGRVPVDKHTRARAEKVLAKRGVKYELIFPTAVWWVACVDE